MFNQQNFVTSKIFSKMQNVFQHLKFLLDFQICFQPINKLLKNHQISKMGNEFFHKRIANIHQISRFSKVMMAFVVEKSVKSHFN